MYKIYIDLSNDAFFHQESHEVARILFELAKKYQERTMCNQPLYDINGNVCGEVIIDDL